ncbi:DUF669 domain-containing protein [Bdellovibrio bacteriovorus]|uniref:DUF669 domain-containing protein n=1 Tax=Bdellovibrio bacteriovorus TaxID=959 RepID=UPI0011D1925F|nr:DUF669 domain-containing protein [Bdellovibrio bacteriovorus]
MGILKPNYNNSIEQVPAGIYTAAIVSATPITTKSGTTAVKVESKITEGPYKDKVIPVTLPLEGKAAGFFKNFVLAVKPDYQGREIATEDLIGRPLKIKVMTSTYPNGARSYLKIAAFPASFDEGQNTTQSQEGIRNEM